MAGCRSGRQGRSPGQRSPVQARVEDRPAHATPSRCHAPPQVSLLRRLFKAALGEEAAKLVDINTIDGFQASGWQGLQRHGLLEPALVALWLTGGAEKAAPIHTGTIAALCPPAPCTPRLQGREKDVAFFSTVRSQRGTRGIGFVADERRINVGLTRAR